MKIRNFLLYACCGLIVSLPAQAQVRFTGDLGIELGGDEVAKAVFDNSSSESLKAGDGLVIDAGVLIPFDREQKTELSLTVGWKYKAITATNGDMSITRFPIEATLYRNIDRHRLGIGAAYHSGIKLDASGYGNQYIDTSVDLTSELGFLLRYDFFFAKNWGIGGKYTSIKYKVSPGDETIDASSFGMNVTARF